MAGCTQVTGGASFCDVDGDYHRFRPEVVDVMNKEEVQQEEKHNQKVDDLCQRS